MAQQLWVKISNKVQGPFTPSQLRHLAASGQLRRHHLVSADRNKWTAAEHVKGLEFTDTPAQSTPGPAARAAEAEQLAPAHTRPQDPHADQTPSEGGPWHLDSAAEPDGSGPYRLSDLLDEVQSQTAGDGSAAGDPLASDTFHATAVASSSLSVSAPGQDAGSVLVRDKQKGALIGAGIILGTLVSGCLVGGALIGTFAETNEALSTLGVLFMLAFWIAGIAAGITAMFGTGAKVTVWTEQPGTVGVQVQKRIAFLGTSSSKARVAASDMLVLSAESIGGGMDKGTIDLIWIILIVGLCLAGAVPGLILWLVWLNARNRADQNISKVTLEARVGASLRPAPLVSVIAKDFTSLRVGAPPEIERVVKLFTARIPIRVVQA